MSCTGSTNCITARFFPSTGDLLAMVELPASVIAHNSVIKRISVFMLISLPKNEYLGAMEHKERWRKCNRRADVVLEETSAKTQYLRVGLAQTFAISGVKGRSQLMGSREDRHD
jgi:hypothetical protein